MARSRGSGVAEAKVLHHIRRGEAIESPLQGEYPKEPSPPSVITTGLAARESLKYCGSGAMGMKLPTLDRPLLSG